MASLKKFWLWLVLFVLLYLFVDLMCFIGIKMTYKNLNNYKILVQSPKIEISEAKGTYANGFIKGILTNNTNSILDKEYIKVDVYSERNVNLGTEYIKIENLNLANSMNFEVKYNYTDVCYYTIDVVEEKPPVEEIKQIRVEEETKLWMAIGGILALWVIIP